MIKADVLKGFSGKDVLVTGGTGLIGHQLVGILMEAGARVMTVSLEQGIPGVVHLRGDLGEPSIAMGVVSGRDFVFHLAGRKGSAKETERRQADFLLDMLRMDTMVLEACAWAKVPRLLYTSSIGAYPPQEVFREEDGQRGEPMDPCAWAKRTGERVVEALRRQFKMKIAVVRPANVYGPWDTFHEEAMVIPALMYRIKHGENPLVIWGDGSAVRDFVYARDVAEGMVLAMHCGTGEGFVNLGSGRGYSIRELAEALAMVTGCRYSFDPTKEAGYPRRVMSIEKAKALLGWEPSTSLEEGLGKTWEWYRYAK